MKENCKKTSKFFKESRRALKYTQKQVGLMLDLPHSSAQSTISQYEAGEVCPPGNRVLDLIDLKIKRGF